MNLRGHDIGVCSWSLQRKDLGELAATLKQLGVSHVQLALGPLVMLDDKRKHQELGHLKAAGLTIAAGMIGFPGEDYSTIDSIRRTGGFVPDAEWPVRKQLAILAGKFAAELGVKQVSTHIGFVPPPGKQGHDVMVERVREIAGAFAAEGVDLLMETGQEPAEELREFLEELRTPNVGINFDPANMILYGAGDPIEAIGVLGPYIRHVHVKDGVASASPGEAWGEEVPFGEGAVDVARFFQVLGEIGYRGPLAIEREAGSDRVGDVRKAIAVIRR